MNTTDLEKLIAQSTPLPWKKKIGKRGVLGKPLRDKFIYLETEIKGNGQQAHVCEIKGRQGFKFGEGPDGSSLEIKADNESNSKLIEYAVNNILRIQQERDELAEALRDLLASVSGGEKSCRHNHHCICPGDKARATLAKIEKGSK